MPGSGESKGDTVAQMPAPATTAATPIATATPIAASTAATRPSEGSDSVAPFDSIPAFALWNGDERAPGKVTTTCRSAPTCRSEGVSNARVGRRASNGMLFRARGSSALSAEWSFEDASSAVGLDVSPYQYLSFWYRLDGFSPNAPVYAEDLEVSVKFATGASGTAVQLGGFVVERAGSWNRVLIALSNLVPEGLTHSNDHRLIGLGWKTNVELAGADFNLYLDDITLEPGEAIPGPLLYKSVPARRTKSEPEGCRFQTASECVDEAAKTSSSSEHAPDSSDAAAAFKAFLPSLNRCLSARSLDREVRLIVEFAAGTAGVSNAPTIPSASTNDCRLIRCIKSNAAQFRTGRQVSADSYYAANLLAEPGTSPTWTAVPRDHSNSFIDQAEEQAACIDKRSGSGGRLPPEVIQEVVRSHYEKFRQCYTDALALSSNLCGKVQVRFIIDQEGKLKSPLVTAATTMPDCKMVQCIKDVYSTIEFPKPEGGEVTVVYPIMFQPG